MRLKDIIIENLQSKPIADQLSHKVAQMYGTEINSYLGSGSWGHAYSTADGKALKLTTDDEEADVANKLKGQRNPHLVTVFDVKEIDGGFAIVQELLDTPDSIKTLYAQADTLMRKYETGWNPEEIKANGGHMDPVLEHFIRSVDKILSAASSIGVYSLDTDEGGNIGMRGKDYVAFDMKDYWPG